MFTGLVEATGTVSALDPTDRGRRLRVSTPLGAELRDGDSIATNGVCLTVVERDVDGFSADLSPETLRVTSFGAMHVGQVVNLERPLRPHDRVGGHFVLGHVDGLGRVAAVRRDGESYWIDIDVEPALAPLLVSKGSVTVDGVSLTVAALGEGRFGVQLIPFTWAHTGLSHLAVGDVVNLEADVLGKYVARLLETRGVIEAL